MVTEGEIHIASGLADDVHRSTLAVGDFAKAIDIFFRHYEPHALLALIADNLAVGEGLVTYWEGVHVDVAASLLDKLGEAVEVSACAMVVDGDDWVVVALDEAADGIEDALLHLRVGALDCVQLDLVAILAGVDAGDGAAAHADAVVIAAKEDDILILFRSLLEGV